MQDMISVIMCHHRGDFIYRAIESVKKSKKVIFEIIVVTSDEGCHKKLETQKDVISVFERGGPAHKRNIGAKFASGRYLAFYDDDVDIDPWCLYYVRKALKKDGVGMVYGKSLNMERRNILDNAGSYLTWTGFLYAREESGVLDKGQYEKPEEIFAGKGAAMAVKRSSFWRVGGFDPVYEILAEETDLSWKMYFIGEKVMWEPRAVLYHAFNTKFKPWNYFYTNKRVYYNGCRNYILMLCKFLEIKNLIRILPFHVLVWFISGLGMMLSGKFEAGLNIWKGLLYHPFHVRDTLMRRRVVQRMRKFSDHEIFKTIMRNPPFRFYVERFLLYIREGRHG